MDAQALRDKISSLNVSSVVPNINLNYNATAISVNFPTFSPNLPEDSLENTLINTSIVVDHNMWGPNKGSYVDVHNTIVNIERDIKDRVIPLLIQVIDSKAPKQTKVFQNMRKMRRTLNNQSISDKLFSDIYDIIDYHFTVTKEVDIKHESNQVHRKNILALLKRITEVYGRENNN